MEETKTENFISEDQSYAPEQEGKGRIFFPQFWTFFAALGGLMAVPDVFGMQHLTSTKALSFTAKAIGDTSAAPLPDTKSGLYHSERCCLLL